eukprot:363009-Chlamydomonas_euryale.AAC.11
MPRVWASGGAQKLAHGARTACLCMLPTCHSSGATPSQHAANACHCMLPLRAARLAPHPQSMPPPLSASACSCTELRA